MLDFTSLITAYRRSEDPLLKKTQISLVLAVISCVLNSSCTTPDAVSKFCASAATTLASAKPVLSDMQASCLRRVDTFESIGSFKTAVSDSNPTVKAAIASCDGIGTKTQGAIAAASILSDYFTAINSLASFGTAKAGTDAGALASKTAAALGEKTDAQTAIGSIVTDLTKVFTAGYQMKKLESDLTRVSSNINNVTAGLITVIQTN